MANPQDQRRTVSDILARYERDCFADLGERTQRDYARHLRVLREYWGDRIATAVTRADIQEFLNVPTGRIQRNRILAVMSSAFSAAIDWKWLDFNVCSRVPRHTSNSRARFVLPDEFEGFKKILPMASRQALELARYTGQPQANILNLRWSQIDEKAEVISFKRQMTKRPVEVPIDSQIRGVLSECKKAKGRRIYVIATLEGTKYTSEGFRSVWQRYMDKWESMGGRRFTFHDIKHTWVAQQKKSENSITFVPSVFQIPVGKVERDLVAVMMPFRVDFDAVYDAMKRACEDCDLRCLRASDLWEESVIIQEIFSLIFRASVVIVDFTGRNPNVMYETGIAHTLGKTVIPITQNIGDVPFDLQHHRVLTYLANREGLESLRSKLSGRLGFIAGRADTYSV